MGSDKEKRREKKIFICIDSHSINKNIFHFHSQTKLLTRFERISHAEQLIE
jgi:hypothetical protein